MYGNGTGCYLAACDYGIRFWSCVAVVPWRSLGRRYHQRCVRAGACEPGVTTSAGEPCSLATRAGNRTGWGVAVRGLGRSGAGEERGSDPFVVRGAATVAKVTEPDCHRGRLGAHPVAPPLVPRAGLNLPMGSCRAHPQKVPATRFT